METGEVLEDDMVYVRFVECPRMVRDYGTWTEEETGVERAGGMGRVRGEVHRSDEGTREDPNRGRVPVRYQKTPILDYRKYSPKDDRSVDTWSWRRAVCM